MKPLLSIWIKPKLTFEYLEKLDENKIEVWTNSLFFFASLTIGFSSVNDFLVLFDINYYLMLLISLVFSGIVGLFLWNAVFSFIYWGSSKIMQGQANRDEIKLVLAFSLVPNLIYLIFGLVLVLVSALTQNTDIVSFQNPITAIILWIFSFRILVVGLSYFNKFSYGFSILTALLPLVLLGFIFLMLKGFL